MDCSRQNRLERGNKAERHIQDVPIPMALGVFIQRRKHDRQDSLDIVANQVAEIFIVPKIQSPLSNLSQSQYDST